MNEFDLQSVFIYLIYPNNSNIYSDKGFVKIDNGSQSGTHWTCFIVERTDHFISIVSVFSQIKSYSNIYLNQ